jgi:cytochrome P450
MQAASDLKLPHLPIEDPKLATDPLPFLEAARREHPWLAISNVGYIVHEYQAIKELTYMDDKFRPSMDLLSEVMGAKGTPWGDFMDNLMLAKAPPEHTRLRNSVAMAFTPRNVNRHRARMREVVSDLLDQWAPKRAFDFAEFAAFFPITVMFGLIGASPSALPRIQKSLETQGLSASLDSSLLPDMQEALRVLWAFVDELIVERQKQGGGADDDVLSTLVAANAAGELSDYELRNLLIFLFAAGYDTSKNMLTLIAYMMLSRPDYWERCAEDRAFCDKIVEEAFRFNSPSNIYRTATEDVVYRDVLFPAGSILFLTLSLASRDPAAFPNASLFEPEREDAHRHMAFGRGIHICLGQHLARAQIQEGVHLIAQRLTKPRLNGEVTWRPFPGVWGIRTLPIAFEPGERRSVARRP